MFTYLESTDKFTEKASLLSEPVATGTWGVPVQGFAWLDDREPVDGSSERGPWLSMVGGEVGRVVQFRPYVVLRTAAVLDEFVALGAECEPEAVANFANRRGWLGRPTDTKARGVPHSDGADLLLCESLGQWREKAAELADLASLIERLGTLESRGFETDRRLLAARMYERNDPDHVVVLGYGGSSLPRDAPAPDRELWNYQRQQLAVAFGESRTRDIAKMMRSLLEVALRQALQGQFSPTIVQHSAVKFVPHNLLAALYYHLLLRLTGASLRRKTCPQCGQEFTYKSRKKAFCDRNCYEAFIRHNAPAITPSSEG